MQKFKRLFILLFSVVFITGLFVSHLPIKQQQNLVTNNYQEWSAGRGSLKLVLDFSLAKFQLLKKQLIDYWKEVKPFFVELKSDFGTLDVLVLSNDTKKAKLFSVLELVQQSDRKEDGEFSAEFLTLLLEFFWHDPKKKDKWELAELRAATKKIKDTATQQLQPLLRTIFTKPNYEKVFTRMQQAKKWTLIVKEHFFNIQSIASLVTREDILSFLLSAKADDPSLLASRQELYALFLGGVEIKDVEKAFVNHLRASDWWTGLLSVLKERNELETDLVGAQVFKIKPNKDIFSSSFISTINDEKQETNFEKLSATLKDRIIDFTNSGVTIDYYLSKVIDEYKDIPDTASTDNTAAKTTTKVNQKSTKTNSLVIGLATVGGGFAVVGIGGLLYWILKMRK